MIYRWIAADLLALCVCLTLTASADTTTLCTPDLPPCRAPADGQVTFSEDFKDSHLARWSTTYPWGSRNLAGPGGSGELQEYVEPSYQGLGLNPFLFEHDGTFAIEANKVTPQLAQELGGKHYISGLLTTYRTFSQKYGYFEMRARFPRGQGLWPAFWLLPIDQSWPPEIDVVECLGNRPTELYATLHTRRSNGLDRPAGFVVAAEDMTSAFHNYGVLWDSKYIAWYLDGRRVAYTPTPKDMVLPMYLLTNLAVGGTWAGDPDATTHFPARMEIAYIRAYYVPPDSDS